MGFVISFAGRIGSGKSSISTALSKSLGWPRTAFGDYLRGELARRGGNPDIREALQDLGQSLVDENPEEFCRAVLASINFEAGSNLLLDGIRHVEIQRIIARLVAPSHAKLIYLSADDSTRLERVATRRDGAVDFSRAEQHRVEADLRDALPTLADAIIGAHAELDTTVDECLELINHWRQLTG